MDTNFHSLCVLQDDMDIAWEAYKEVQQTGSEEEKSEAFKKWEELKRQVDIVCVCMCVCARARARACACACA